MDVVRRYGTRGGSNWIRLSTRCAIYLRDGFDCVWCRLVFPPSPLGYGLTLDHVVPGAGNGPGNLVTACPGCNFSRQRQPASKFGTPAALSRIRRALARPIDRGAGLRLAAERRALRR